jgi:starch phosphorylase
MKVAYFSMEIGIDPAIPTYSGGLGILAGDTLKAAADLGLSMIGVTLLYRKGYLRQAIAANGEQLEGSESWEPEQMLSLCEPIVEVPLRDRVVAVRAWKRVEVGVTGHAVPILFLDTDVPQNAPEDRSITHSLYAGDAAHRIRQELVLGVGGVALLRALGYGEDLIYHMNEGHAAFLLCDLLPEGSLVDGELDKIRRRVVFTTHTPVPAGHDVFQQSLLEQILSPRDLERVSRAIDHHLLNMTHLAMRYAGTVNAVSAKHRDVTRRMFPEAEVIAVTNGVHPVRWTSEPFSRLFDRHIPGWRIRGEQLRHAALISTDEIRQAHAEARKVLLDTVQQRLGMPFGGSGILIGFARRATEYKRPLLVFRDPARLHKLAEAFGPINLLFAGKAHPHDEIGKQLIRSINEFGHVFGDLVRVAFLPNYDVNLASILCAGVDLWLNTPRAPLEASGTSGMKCALNGVPSLSVADGWWLEGGLEGITGWTVRSSLNEGGLVFSDQDSADAEALYRELEQRVLPMFFHASGEYAHVMRNAIAMNGSFFNTHRMVEQYRSIAYERYA